MSSFVPPSPKASSKAFNLNFSFPRSISPDKDALKPNAHPYPIQTTSSGLLSRHNSSPRHHQHHASSPYRYVPSYSPPRSRKSSVTQPEHSHRYSKSLTSESPRPLPIPPSPTEDSSSPLARRPSSSASTREEESHARRLAALAELPQNPKQWTSSQLATYLSSAFRFRVQSFDAEHALPKPVARDITKFVRESKITGRTFLKLTEDEIQKFGVNQLWRSALLNASQTLRQNVHRGQIWDAFPDSEAPLVTLISPSPLNGAVFTSESEGEGEDDNTPGKRTTAENDDFSSNQHKHAGRSSLVRSIAQFHDHDPEFERGRLPPPSPTSSVSSTSSSFVRDPRLRYTNGRVKGMIATLERSASFGDGEDDTALLIPLPPSRARARGRGHLSRRSGSVSSQTGSESGGSEIWEEEITARNDTGAESESTNMTTTNSTATNGSNGSNTTGFYTPFEDGDELNGSVHNESMTRPLPDLPPMPFEHVSLSPSLPTLVNSPGMQRPLPELPPYVSPQTTGGSATLSGKGKGTRRVVSGLLVSKANGKGKGKIYNYEQQDEEELTMEELLASVGGQGASGGGGAAAWELDEGVIGDTVKHLPSAAPIAAAPVIVPVIVEAKDLEVENAGGASHDGDEGERQDGDDERFLEEVGIKPRTRRRMNGGGTGSGGGGIKLRPKSSRVRGSVHGSIGVDGEKGQGKTVATSAAGGGGLPKRRALADLFGTLDIDNGSTTTPAATNGSSSPSPQETHIVYPEMISTRSVPEEDVFSSQSVGVVQPPTTKPQQTPSDGVLISNTKVKSRARARAEASERKLEEIIEQLQSEIEGTKRMVCEVRVQLEDVERKVGGMESVEEEWLTRETERKAALAKQQADHEREQERTKEEELKRKEIEATTSIDSETTTSTTSPWFLARSRWIAGLIPLGVQPRMVLDKVLAMSGVSLPPPVPSSTPSSSALLLPSNSASSESVASASDSHGHLPATNTGTLRRGGRKKARSAAAVHHPTLAMLPPYVLLVSIGVCAVVLRVVLRRALKEAARR